MNKRAENLAKILLILFIVTVCSTNFTKIYLMVMAPSLAELPSYNHFNIQTKFLSFVYFLFGLAVPIGSSIWLFITAKKKNGRPWLWSLLGLFSGIFAVILWYLVQLHELLQSNLKKVDLEIT